MTNTPATPHFTPEDVSEYLGKRVVGKLEGIGLSVTAFSAICEDGSRYLVKLAERMTLPQLSWSESRARRERAAAHRVRLLGGSVIRPVDPVAGKPITRLHGNKVRSPRDSLVVYEWLHGARDLERTEADLRKGIRVYGATDAAVELAGRWRGPWTSYLNNGPNAWRAMATSAILLGETQTWVDTVMKHADALGALEMCLPPSPHSDSTLVLDNIDNAPGLYRNIMIQEDGTAIVVDLEQIAPRSKTSTADHLCFKFRQSDAILGDGVSEKLYKDGYEEVMSKYGALVPAEIRWNPLHVEIGKRLYQLRSEVRRTIDDNERVDSDRVERAVEQLVETFLPLAVEQGLITQAPALETLSL